MIAAKIFYRAIITFYFNAYFFLRRRQESDYVSDLFRFFATTPNPLDEKTISLPHHCSVNFLS
jgi:hypothetical protein